MNYFRAGTEFEGSGAVEGGLVGVIAEGGVGRLTHG